MLSCSPSSKEAADTLAQQETRLDMSKGRTCHRTDRFSHLWSTSSVRCHPLSLGKIYRTIILSKMVQFVRQEIKWKLVHKAHRFWEGSPFKLVVILHLFSSLNYALLRLSTNQCQTLAWLMNPLIVWHNISCTMEIFWKETRCYVFLALVVDPPEKVIWLLGWQKTRHAEK